MDFQKKKIKPERVWVAPEFKGMLYELKAVNPQKTIQEISQDLTRYKDEFKIKFKKKGFGDFFVKI